MQFDLFIESIRKEKIKYSENEPMRNHTSFKIGGNADVLIRVKNTEELTRTLVLSKKYGVPSFVIGRGSNLLVSDGGIEGAVISLCDMDEIEADGERIICGAGASLSSACRAACENSLTGLEFAFGIPGSVGGALYMNAGAYGGEMSYVVEAAEYIDFDGNTGKITNAEMWLGYRTSVFMTSEKIITKVIFNLKKGDKKAISERMNELIERRKQKQPLEFPSAGSTFKRPEGHFAGALIEKNGLKGAKIGGAMVSEKHAGFIINYDNASCNDVKSLIKQVQDKVYENDGVMLSPEVIFKGR